ncbi:putative immunoglobulin superfamily member 1-like [Scophthalmus maximus]|nr:putative immunoglobulin superfamily member 1-like [Scophthalmus maximus]
MFSIPKMDFDDDGLYECQYEKNISEKTFSSSPSDSVRLSVTVTFPKPSISMNPVGKVTWGEDAGITCSISTQNLGGTFILLKTPGSFKETQSLSNGSANFSIPNVGFVDGGSYLCLYEKMGFSSEPSDSVRLSVAVPLSLLVSSIAAGMMMLLLLVVLLLVMCMVGRRKRRTAERHGAPILSQLTATTRCEDDEDRHYMKLLARDNNKGLKDTAEEEDSGDYERLSNDEDQHYDDVGLGKHLARANEVCVNVEGNREDEDVDDDAVEETNDDENGYLDLTRSFDQTDIIEKMRIELKDD